jgi:hypothetical protein
MIFTPLCGVTRVTVLRYYARLVVWGFACCKLRGEYPVIEIVTNSGANSNNLCRLQGVWKLLFGTKNCSLSVEIFDEQQIDVPSLTFMLLHLRTTTHLSGLNNNGEIFISTSVITPHYFPSIRHYT